MSEAQLIHTTDSEQDTLALGKVIGEHLIEDLMIALVGPLGAGKTQLVKGIAAGNGLADTATVTSPTFTLVNEYPGRIPLFHLDTYRLTREQELIALGFDEMLDSGSVVLVEWADRMEQLMPSDALWIRIEPSGATSRHFRFEPTGPTANRCVEQLAARLR